MTEKSDYFTEENRLSECQEVYTSPSGSFKLVVDWYKTEEGCWNYTCGRVYHHNSWNPIAEVKRNYSSFPFYWIEEHPEAGHPDEYDYLLCGSDYQGQTFIQLNTGERRDQLSERADKGCGFCWSDYQLLSPSVLLVEGCYWGAPYEYKLFDVSNPMKGWPEYKLPEEVYLGIEGEVTFTGDGLVVWTQYEMVQKETGRTLSDMERDWRDKRRDLGKARYLGASEEEIDRLKQIADDAYIEWEEIVERGEEEKWDKRVFHRYELRPVGNTMELVSEYKSGRLVQREQEAREAREAKKKRLAGVKKYKKACPIYKKLKSKLGKMKDRTYVIYPSLRDRWEGDDNPFYFVVRVSKDSNRSVSLKWGVESGSIVREEWVRGVGTTKTEFTRSKKGLKEALKYDARQPGF